MLTTRLLKETDTDWFSELYAANQRDALSPEEREKYGFIQGSSGPEAVDKWIHSGRGLVAELDGQPAGVAMAGPSTVPSDHPAGRAMEIAVNEGIDRPILWGPVVVGRAFRGQGISRALWEAVVATYRGEYAHAVAMVELSNRVSYEAHLHMGWKIIGEMSIDERNYAAIAKPLTV